MHTFVVFFIIVLMLICRKMYNNVESLDTIQGATGSHNLTNVATKGTTGVKGTTGPKEKRIIKKRVKKEIIPMSRQYEGIKYF